MSRNSNRAKNRLTLESKNGLIYLTVTKEDIDHLFDYIGSLTKQAQASVSPGSLQAAELMWYALLGSMAISAIGSVINLHKLKESVRSSIEKVRQQRFYGGIPKEEWLGVIKEIKQAQESVTVPVPVSLTAQAIETLSGYAPVQALRHVAAFTLTGLLVWVGSWVGGKIGDLIANENLTREVSADVAEAKKKMLNSLKRLIKAKMPEPFGAAIEPQALPEGVSLTKTASEILWTAISAVPPAFVYGLYGLGAIAAILTYSAFEKAHPQSSDPEQAAVAKALNVLSGSPYPVEVDPDEFQQIFAYKTTEQSVGRPAIPYGLSKSSPDTKSRFIQFSLE